MGRKDNKFTKALLTGKGFEQDGKGNWRPKPKPDSTLFPELYQKKKPKTKLKSSRVSRKKTNEGRVHGFFNHNKHYEGIDQLEDDFHIDVVSFLEKYLPHLFFAHPPNGGNRSGREGAKFQRMGVRKGLIDLLIFNRGKATYSNFNGLAMELKVKGGSVSEDQLYCMNKLHKHGWKCIVCWNWSEVLMMLNAYFNQKFTMEDVEKVIIERRIKSM